MSKMLKTWGQNIKTPAPWDFHAMKIFLPSNNFSITFTDINLESKKVSDSDFFFFLSSKLFNLNNLFVTKNKICCLRNGGSFSYDLITSITKYIFPRFLLPHPLPPPLTREISFQSRTIFFNKSFFLSSSFKQTRICRGNRN